MEGHFLQKLILVGLLASCGSAPEKPLSLDTNLLKNGDLVYRYGNGFFSKYFRKVSDSVQTYSHVGMLHVTPDSIHVIHSEASELTFVGFVQRQPLQEFLYDVNEWGIYRLDSSDSIRDRIAASALAYHKKRVPFDMAFSLDNEDIYCTELAAICVNEAVGYELVKPMTVILGKYGFSVDDTFLVEGIYKVISSQDVEEGIQ